MRHIGLPGVAVLKCFFALSSCFAAALLAEVENLPLRLFYMDNAKEDVRGDIAVMRRAAEKAESDVAKVEMEKQKQVR